MANLTPDQLPQWRRYAEAAIASLPHYCINTFTADSVCAFADKMMDEEAKRLEEAVS